MPRENRGYDPVPVCSFCVENLRTTAGSRNYLKTLSLGKLKKYADAYNLRSDQVIEKDDLVDKLMSYRGANGCLPPENEEFYRKHSVPNLSGSRPRGLFSRQAPPVPPPTPGPRPQRPQSYFPRPDVEPQWQPPPARSPRPTSMPQPQYSTRPQAPQQGTNSSSRPQQSNLDVPRPNQSTRPRTTSHGAATPPPPPTLDRLLTMAPEDIRSLPVSALKDILFHNHVNARLLIEKSDLVEKVTTLIADERRERERQEIFRQMEEEQERFRRMEMEIASETHIEQMGELHLDSEQPVPDADPEPSPETGLGQSSENGDSSDNNERIPTTGTGDMNPPEHQTTADTPAPSQSKSRLDTRPGMTIGLERNGLCVICQDEEANIAIVDCGHMAMCRGCSDLVMSSTRECPLCRTRIVTEARLLRIFKA